MSREIEKVKEKTSVEIERIDVMKHPLVTLKDGVKWIPAVKIGDKVLYGKDLNEDRILRELKSD